MYDSWFNDFRNHSDGWQQVGGFIGLYKTFANVLALLCLLAVILRPCLNFLITQKTNVQVVPAMN
jgi:hypothetical protein